MEWLKAKGEIVETPFHSALPIIGPLIVRFRTVWNNIASRWYVLGMFQQQSEFNQLMVQQWAEQEARLLAQDKEIVELTKTVATLELQVKRLKKG